jgi:hypothetical protein
VQVGSIGDVVFETSAERVLTPDSLQRSREARYEDHQVQGELPRPEFIAPDLSEVELGIRLNAGLGVNPVEMSDQIATYCKEGRVVHLIIAGYNFGKVTVRKFSTDWRHLSPNGRGVQTVDLKLTLKEYV